MGGPLFDMGWRTGQTSTASPDTTVEAALAVLLRQLCAKWVLALSTSDPEVADMLETDEPPSLGVFKAMFPGAAEE